MRDIFNATQHNATPEQREAGVYSVPSFTDYEGVEHESRQELLTFNSIPSNQEMQERAEKLVEMAINTGAKKAMIGGAPFFMSTLETAFLEAGIKPVYAFSVRESVETTDDDGKVIKTNVFKHIGFVEVGRIPG